MKNYVKPRLEFVSLTPEETYAAGSERDECVVGTMDILMRGCGVGATLFICPNKG